MIRQTAAEFVAIPPTHTHRTANNADDGIVGTGASVACVTVVVVVRLDAAAAAAVRLVGHINAPINSGFVGAGEQRTACSRPFASRRLGAVVGGDAAVAGADAGRLWRSGCLRAPLVLRRTEAGADRVAARVMGGLGVAGCGRCRCRRRTGVVAQVACVEWVVG